MDNIVLKVDGKALPKEVSKFKWKKADISGKSAGRTRDLLMHKDKKGEKRTLSLGWVNLTKEQIHETLKPFDPEYVQVTYWDPKIGQDVEKTFYTGDMDANMKWWYKGHERWNTLEFDIVER